MSKPGPDETHVICSDCNAYLWSEARCDHKGESHVTVRCPCVKVAGKCSGQLAKPGTRKP